MKMLMIIVDDKYNDTVEDLLADHDVKGFTEIPMVLGEGSHGKKLGSRLHPGLQLAGLHGRPGRPGGIAGGCPDRGVLGRRGMQAGGAHRRARGRTVRLGAQASNTPEAAAESGRLPRREKQRGANQ